MLLGSTAYGNYHYKHGSYYNTNDIICLGNDRGPCSPATAENTKGLNIPNWAKWERTSGAFLVILSLGVVGCYTSVKANPSFNNYFTP